MIHSNHLQDWRLSKTGSGVIYFGDSRAYLSLFEQVTRGFQMAQGFMPTVVLSLSFRRLRW
jgi:hypothetical protein